MAKDPRFDPEYQKTQQMRESTNQIQGKEIGNTTILTEHLVNGAITSEKLSSISIPQPFHSAYHLSTTTSGWVRVAQLQNLSSVEFWLKISVSGHHAMAKIVGNYTFIGGSPSVSFALVSSSRYGTGYTDVRVLYKSTYDPVYFEVLLPQSAYIAVGQISAFGETYANFSNITMVTGSVPSGYASDQQNWGNYDSAMIMV
jgi:pSer/pThr/pTyr-binding forkhead associated (FHA) protein